MKKITCNYNELFFTENKRIKGDNRNSDFWQKIDDLTRAYPNTELIITRTLNKNKHVSYYYEDLLFESDSPKVLKLAIEIYQRHYYIVPLVLYENTPETNAELDRYLRHGKENP